MNVGLFAEIRKEQRAFMSYMKLYALISLLGLVGGVQYITSEEKVKPIIVTLMIVGFVLFSAMIIILMVKAQKTVKRLANEKLIPELIKKVNYKWVLERKSFIKEEALNSFFIYKGGSFKSTPKINATNQTEFSYVTNYVSTGQTVQEIFAGTFLRIKLTKKIDGMIQIRTKGKPKKQKKANLDIKKVSNEWTEQFEQLSFFASSEALFQVVVTKELVRLYNDLNSYLLKGKLMMTIYQNEMIIGIQDRYNFMKHPMLVNISEKTTDKQIKHMSMVNDMIKKTSYYLDQERS